MKSKKGSIAVIIGLTLLGIVFVGASVYSFNHYDWFRALFTGGGSDVMGEVAPNSPQSIAARTRLSAQISMMIFAVITALQLVAFGAGWAAARNVDSTDATPEIKQKLLENANVFFDVPLYVGLFGTVSAFLVMTFSPQSSRLIAYSSTLIGIIFSLILKLTMEYPLRKRLLREESRGAAEGVRK